jgi:hypothetical protein
MTNTLKKSGIVISFLFCLILNNCTTGYYREKNFKRYLKDIFHMTSEEDVNGVFYVINMNECEECLDKHFSALNLIKPYPQTKIIVVGSVLKQEWKAVLEKITAEGTVVFYDESGEGIRYDFGLQKPIIVKFYYGNLIKFIQIPDREIHSLLMTNL